MINFTNKKTIKNNLELVLMVLTGLGIFLVWFFYPYFLQKADVPLPKEPPKVSIPFKPNLETDDSKAETRFQKVGEIYGTYGDSYGSLNTLFSGLAFAVLIISLFMQRQELRAQREELEAQRNEIKESNTIANEQRKIAEKQSLITEQQAQLNEQQILDAKVQNFYTLLFKFLDEKKNKIKSLEISRNSEIKGNYVFDRFYQESLLHIQGKFAYNVENLKNSNEKVYIPVIVSASSEAHAHTRETIIDNEYFEYICFILRYIEEHDHLKTSNDAVKIFISHQTINEMYTMFITAINNANNFDNNELINFIQKYALLRKINTYHTPDKYFSILINKTLGEDSYIPKSKFK